MPIGRSFSRIGFVRFSLSKTSARWRWLLNRALSHCFLIAIMCLAQTTGAAAQQILDKSHVEIFKSGNWTGILVWDERGELGGCQMYSHYATGVSLIILATFDGWWGIEIINKAWTFEEGGNGNALLTIDNTPLLRNKTTITPPNKILFPIGREGPTLRALRRGSLLEFQTTQNVVRLTLEGTHKAIGELKNCIETEGAKHSEDRGGSGAPQTAKTEPPAEAPIQSIDYVEREKTIIFISNLLTRAGLNGFQLEASDDSDPSIVAWKLPSGAEGSVSIARATDSSVTAFETLSSRDISGDAKACTGQYTSGLRPETIAANTKVRHMFTRCDDTDSSFSRSHVYALNDKFVLSMGLLRKGEGALDERNSDLDADLIRHADWALLE